MQDWASTNRGAGRWADESMSRLMDRVDALTFEESLDHASTFGVSHERRTVLATAEVQTRDGGPRPTQQGDAHLSSASVSR
jgi:hypothetical protein